MVESMHDDTIQKLESRKEENRNLKRILEQCQSAELKTFKAFKAQKVTLEELKKKKSHDPNLTQIEFPIQKLLDSKSGSNFPYLILDLQSIKTITNTSPSSEKKTDPDPDQDVIKSLINRTSKGKYQCIDCGYHSLSISATKDHVESQHLNHTYRCKKCATVTNTWSSYLRHMRLKHMNRK